MRSSRGLVVAAATATTALVLAGCGDSSATEGGDAEGSAEFSPVTIEHVYGETVIETKPERVATVAWANHEVPLALGVVPVGMSKATWGDDDGDGVLPWVEDKLEELGAETPALFDETDGIDFEAVADTAPDVILASYSGLTEEEYETLSNIAPTVPYTDGAWATSVQDMILVNSEAMGMAAEGEALVAELDEYAAEAFAERPELAGAKVLFTYIDPTDFSQVGYYSSNDTRPGFLADLGMGTPDIVADNTTDAFYDTISAEEGDKLADVDVLVTYGADDSFIAQLQNDKLLAKIPAIAEGAVAVLPDSTPLAASANPSPLSIEATLDEYLDLLAAAVAQGG